MAETKIDANAAFDAFVATYAIKVATYAIKYDKAVGYLSPWSSLKSETSLS